VSSPKFLVVVAVFIDGRFYVSNAFSIDQPEVCASWLSQFEDEPRWSFLSKSVSLSELA